MSSTIEKNRFTLDKGITVSGTQVTGAAETSIWTFEQVAQDTYVLYNEAAGGYASAKGTGGKQVEMLTSVSGTAGHWKITSSSDPYTIENVGNRALGINQYVLRRNADFGFAPYVSNTGTAISLYRQLGGRAVYTTTQSLAQQRGDMNGDGEVTDADALYLLRFTLFPDRFPITQSGDVNGDSAVTDADALYLLRFTLFPDRFPLV